MYKHNINLLPMQMTKSYESEGLIPKNIISVGANKKWEQGYTGNGIVIAILDSGCDTKNLSLVANIIDGYNFTEEHNGDTSNFEDLNGHGTHVAGILAASKNKKGTVGVAPNAKLLILKVLDELGKGSVETVVKALNYATKWRGPYGEKVRVISLSLGTRNPNEDMYRAIKKAITEDIPVVVASGNDGDGNINTDEYRYPGAYDEVIEVGAVDDENNIAPFTNTNRFVDIYAPGVDINSTFLQNEFAVLSGTSMAVPHVAGAIAIIIEEHEKKYGVPLREHGIHQLLRKYTDLIKIDENNNINVLSLK